MTLDEALGQAGRLVGAWDLRFPDRPAIAVYVTAESGAKLLHREDVAAEQREVISDKIRDRGARLGCAYSYTGHVWVVDDRGIGVWTEKSSLVEGSTLVVGLRNGGVKPRDIQRVIAFVNPKNSAHRGLRVELATGQLRVVAEERDEAAKANPFYDEDTLRDDMRWAVLLGQDLAIWLGVPFTDQDGDTTNANQLAVHKVDRALANAISALPASGDFEHVIQPIGQFGRFGMLQYRYAPNPMDATKRFLELRLHTPSGKSSWARWVKQGTNEQVAAFLRFVRTPYTIGPPASASS